MIKAYRILVFSALVAGFLESSVRPRSFLFGAGVRFALSIDRPFLAATILTNNSTKISKELHPDDAKLKKKNIFIQKVANVTRCIRIISNRLTPHSSKLVQFLKRYGGTQVNTNRLLSNHIPSFGSDVVWQKNSMRP